jgi:NADH-quinone oxidoreductase subunit H
MLSGLFKLLIFPGMLFMIVYGMCMEFVDRKVYAKFQNRIGPPWYQPLADLLKLLGKEVIIPSGVKHERFRILPVISLASVIVAFIYVPVAGLTAADSFEGDLIIVLYFSMIPALMSFLAGWYSRSVYATIGSTRTLTQLFSYEAPLFVSLLTPALLAHSWSISAISAYYNQHPLYILLNIPAFVVAMTTIQGKLERVPFDQSEAETEIVSGVYVEYSGRLLALFRLASDCEMVLMFSLMAAIFLPFVTGNPIIDFILYILKTCVLMLILTLVRATMGRLRMEQMATFCWQKVTPIALAEMLLIIILRGVLPA